VRYLKESLLSSPAMDVVPTTDKNTSSKPNFESNGDISLPSETVTGSSLCRSISSIPHASNAGRVVSFPCSKEEGIRNIITTGNNSSTGRVNSLGLPNNIAEIPPDEKDDIAIFREDSSTVEPSILHVGTLMDVEADAPNAIEEHAQTSTIEQDENDGLERSTSTVEDDEKASQNSEDESDYEYDYEDEEESHLTGFLVSTDHYSSNSGVAQAPSAPDKKESLGPKLIDCQGESRGASPDVSSERPSEVKSSSSSAAAAQPARKSTWREPSTAAVNMSLRAEREKTGGKRRLASDLYKIMMGDTKEQGFSMEPSSDDSMDKWKIKLFGFDPDSNLQKDMMVLGLDHVELEMSFPDQYPFEPPFVRVVRPRFKRQTGFVMNGALCMELLTNEGWNPVNDIESVIVSIRSLLVVGDARLSAAVNLPARTAIPSKKPEESKNKSNEANKAQGEQDDIAMFFENNDASEPRGSKRVKVMEGNQGAAGVAMYHDAANEEDNDDDRMDEDGDDSNGDGHKGNKKRSSSKISAAKAGTYTSAEARAAYSHLSDYHKKKGWDSNGWWARKG